MNIIQYALNNVRYEISQNLLSMAYSQQLPHTHQNVWNPSTTVDSVDSIIRRDVIEKRVNVDCNLVGGKEEEIDLRRAHEARISPTEVHYRIPFDVTDGKLIIAAKSISYAQDRIANYVEGTSNPIALAGIDMYNAMMPIPDYTTTDVEIIGDNVIACRDRYYRPYSTAWLVCTIENDEMLQNMPRGAFRGYSKLVVLATKADIYIRLRHSFDQGAVAFGRQLGELKNELDDFRDANERYNDFLREEWAATAFTADRKRMYKHVRSMIGRGQ